MTFRALPNFGRRPSSTTGTTFGVVGLSVFALIACTTTDGDPAVDNAGTGGQGGASGGSAGAGVGGSTGGSVAGVGGSVAGTGGSPTTGGSGGVATGGTAGSSAGGTGGGVAGAQGGTPSGGAGASAGSAGTAGDAASGGAGAGGTPSGGAGAGGAPIGGAGAGGSTGGTAGATHTGPWVIMPLGDSITQSSCYPQLLSQKLITAGRTNFQFVGTTTNNQSCSGAPNVKSEGHGGYLVTCLTGDRAAGSCSAKGSPAELMTWMQATPAPDVVLMLLGTNDAWTSDIPIATITGAYTKVVTSIRTANANAIIFVGQILPMHPDGCMNGQNGCPDNRAEELNAAIPAWATSQSTATSPITVVNIYASVGTESAFVPNSALSADGVHPTASAAGMMADTWLAALTTAGIP